MHFDFDENHVIHVLQTVAGEKYFAELDVLFESISKLIPEDSDTTDRGDLEDLWAHASGDLAEACYKAGFLAGVKFAK